MGLFERFDRSFVMGEVVGVEGHCEEGTLCLLAKEDVGENDGYEEKYEEKFEEKH